MKLRDNIKIVQITEGNFDEYYNLASASWLPEGWEIFSMSVGNNEYISINHITSHQMYTVTMGSYVLFLSDSCVILSEQQYNELFETKHDFTVKPLSFCEIDAMKTACEHTPDVAFIHTDCDGVLKKHEEKIEKLTKAVEFIRGIFDAIPWRNSGDAKYRRLLKELYDD